MTSLYVDHFGLSEAPFSITPNPHFFFAGSGRGSLLEALRYAVRSEEGIVTVIGEVGSGKTMLCRMLLDDLPEGIDAIYLGNPSFSRFEILDAIAHDLGVTKDAGPTRIDALNAELIRRYGNGRRVVLLIDEAHAMPRDSLEEVRLLSNLETSQHKLLNIVLFGQPELNQLLEQRDMRQLRERIVQRFELGPLPRSEIADYLAFRLRVAGHRDSFPFHPNAVQLIGRCSEGITRRINILADKALLSVFARNARRVERADVERAARDAGLVAPKARDPRRWWQGAAVAAGLIAAFVLGQQWSKHPTTGGDAGLTTATVAVTELTPAAATALSAPAPAPAPAPAAESERSVSLPQADSAPKAEPVDQLPSRAVGTTTEISSRPAAPASPEAMPQTATESAPKVEPNALLRYAERDLRSWVMNDDGGFTLQVASLRTNDDDSASWELQRLSSAIPGEVIRVQRTGSDANQRFLYFFGEFATYPAAAEAIARLPEALRNNQPIVRSHSAVRAGVNPQS